MAGTRAKSERIWEHVARRLREADGDEGGPRRRVVPQGGRSVTVYSGASMSYRQLAKLYRHLGGEGIPAPDGGILPEVKPPADAPENWKPDMEPYIQPHWSQQSVDAVRRAVSSARGEDPRAGAVRTYAATRQAAGFRAPMSPQPVHKGDPRRPRTHVGDQGAHVDKGLYRSIMVPHPTTGKLQPKNIKPDVPAAPYSGGKVDPLGGRATDLYDVIVMGATTPEAAPAQARGQNTRLEPVRGRAGVVVPQKVFWLPDRPAVGQSGIGADPAEQEMKLLDLVDHGVVPPPSKAPERSPGAMVRPPKPSGHESPLSVPKTKIKIPRDESLRRGRR